MAAVQGWSRWYDDAPTHPKFLTVGHKGGWLYVCGQAYASTHATDGLIPKAIVPRLTDVPRPMKVAEQLVEAGLWHDRGDHFEQHDYTEMQTTAEEREAKREKKARAGGRGNHVKWHVERGIVAPDCRFCDRDETPNSDRKPLALASANGSHRGSPEAEAEAETETETTATSDVPSDPDVSEEARTLTREFAKAVKANGHGIPTQGSKARDSWLIEMDRLLRLGPPGEGSHVPDPDEVRRVITFVTNDTFEMANVRSVPKLRERYSQLRIKAGHGTNGQQAGLVNGAVI